MNNINLVEGHIFNLIARKFKKYREGKKILQYGEQYALKS